MNKNTIQKIIFSLVITTIFIPSYASAFVKTTISVENKNDFVVEPGKTELLLSPGDTVVKNVTITNRINRPVHFILSTEDLVGSDDPRETVKLLGDERGPYSIKDLIKPEIYDFTLGLGDRIVIPVKISVPVDAEPRGYYGALIIAGQPPESANGTSTEAEGQTRLVSRIGSLFLVRVKGEGKEEGGIQDFKIISPKKLFYEKRPEGFEVAFHNTGTVHLVPYGQIDIKNMMGRVIDTLPIDAYFVLPDSVRHRQISWTNGFAFGRYKAIVTLHKGYNNEVEGATVAFWVLPWKILIAVFAGLVLLVSFFYYISSRFELKKK